MSLTARDERVLGYLRARGPGLVTAAEVASAARLPRITAETCLYVLAAEGWICWHQQAAYLGSSRYVIRHLHEVPDERRLQLFLPSNVRPCR